jgi:hypothetical protein
MPQIESKRDRIINQFRRWFEDHGSCVWSVDQVAEATEIPQSELYNNDDFSGLLMDLNNDGVLCRFDGDHFSLVIDWGRR